MLRLIITDSKNVDFIRLVADLDAYLREIDGDSHGFYDTFNQIDELKYVVIAFQNDKAIACGAIKKFNSESMEVKRMFSSEAARGKGYASEVLKNLERWSTEMAYTKCVLETGKRQPKAIAFYQKNGYHIIPNYGQYRGLENSVCFQKTL